MWLEPAPSCFSMLKPYCSATPPPPPLTTALKALVATTTEESDVGIFCYISQLPGFRGILKQRYSDFMVNEVDKEGNVVHLTNLDAPVEAVQESGTTTGDGTSKDYTTEIESFRALAGPNDAERLETFIKQINSGGEDGVMPIVLSPDYDKSHRTAVHNFFKQHFKFLVTDTVDGPDASSKCIRVRINSGGQNSRGRNSRKRKERGDKPFDSRGSEDWSEHVGKFLRFHLYKENKDTQEALGVIGKMLGVQPRSFGFAGTKDKRAVTTQRVTVFKKLASKLAALNDRLISIKVGDFCYVTEGLVLGQLLGNWFTITLRGVVADSEDTIKASASALGKQGFINYFGLQRFGSGSVPTHLIGASLLRGEWKSTVSMFLDPREGERNVITEAREYYKETNDIEGTLRKLPRHLVSERAILQCLKKCPGNYLQALRAIPRTLRMMYVHSYQSYLWNHAASMRVKKYGTDQVVLGDLVYCKGNETEKVTEVVSSECVDENGDDTLDPNDLGDIADTNLPEEKLSLVKAVTAEDIQSGNYTIEDVVLPMPGSRVIFPENDIADVFHDLAKKDEISLTESVHDVKYGSSFTPQLASYLTHLVSLFREFSITSVTGNYRRIFQKPMDFEWGILKYSDGTIPLVDTDLDKIAKTKPASVDKEDPASLNGDGSLHDNAKQTECVDNDIGGNREKLPEVGSLSDTNPQETQMALKLSFTLPASCYATMAIRELLKTSTSVAFHKTLN
ncbi:multisubstrate pseudouridine synthase 7-like isoform X2 [Malus sylvestris]|uniref:multisubstrate pseudouridine synthase 7-like isoform X2 n=1 Tax=Malus sylvestris TaxID=3752 RepID=UPI0021AC8FFB|nr:multisubstrate pseudouridine synthase 7-like isoform X2 [Malus sylvestris]